MSDRRSQRIRQQLRQHPNPRNRVTDTSFATQMRRMYAPPAGQSTPTPDCHAQLARQLEMQRKSRR